MDEKKINADLIRFWDEAMTLQNEAKEEARKEELEDYLSLAPSPKLAKAVQGLSRRNKVLDYGCGSGWASIVLAKEGCPKVVAVDLGEHIIESLRFYASLYGVEEEINAKAVDPDWLESVPSASFDGLVCSNVLDVVPVETGDKILAEFGRILEKGAQIVIGLNFFMSPAAAASRGMELVEGKYLFVNGVLRLTNLSDEEWEKRFEPYFDIEKFDYFAWPGEAKESRRLFLLRRK